MFDKTDRGHENHQNKGRNTGGNNANRDNQQGFYAAGSGDNEQYTSQQNRSHADTDKSASGHGGSGTGYSASGGSAARSTHSQNQSTSRRGNSQQRHSNANKGNTQEHTHHTSPVDIERYMKGIQFPARKQDLLNQAESNSAPSDVLDMIDRFDESSDFKNVTDISKAYAAVH